MCAERRPGILVGPLRELGAERSAQLLARPRRELWADVVQEGLGGGQAHAPALGRLARLLVGARVVAAPRDGARQRGAVRLHADKCREGRPEQGGLGIIDAVRDVLVVLALVRHANVIAGV